MASHALPGTPKPRLDWRRHHAVATVRSPFTGKTFRHDYGADWWMVRLLLPPMSTARAGAWYAWVENINGGVNTFPLTPPGESSAVEFIVLEPIAWAENPTGTLVLFQPIEAVEAV